MDEPEMLNNGRVWKVNAKVKVAKPQKRQIFSQTNMD